MLEIKDLTFSYPRQSVPVIDHVSLTVEGGSVYGLLGPNGAGKSTLLYLISGLLTPRTGSVTFDGVNTRLRLPQTLEQIFIVPEEFRLPSMRLDEYVDMYAPYYPNFSRETLNKCLELFCMPEKLHLGALSMGQKKKAYISFALATGTRLLLMDEPTNGLDIPSKAGFRRIITQCLDDDKAVIISTHQVRDIEQLLDHVVIMNQNKVLLNSSMARVASKLAFGLTTDPEEIASALLSMPDLMGTAVVKINDGTAETEINLEMLFQLTVKQPETMAQLFKD